MPVGNNLSMYQWGNYDDPKKKPPDVQGLSNKSAPSINPGMGLPGAQQMPQAGPQYGGKFRSEQFKGAQTEPKPEPKGRGLGNQQAPWKQEWSAMQAASQDMLNQNLAAIRGDVSAAARRGTEGYGMMPGSGAAAGAALQGSLAGAGMLSDVRAQWAEGDMARRMGYLQMLQDDAQFKDNLALQKWVQEQMGQLTREGYALQYPDTTGSHKSSGPKHGPDDFKAAGKKLGDTGITASNTAKGEQDVTKWLEAGMSPTQIIAMLKGMGVNPSDYDL